MIARTVATIACAAVLTSSVSVAEQKPRGKQVTSSEVSKDEALLVEGLELLRAWKLTEADDALGQVCPKFKEVAGDGTSLEDLACSARAVSKDEVKGAPGAADRADGYWWGGERARRTGKIQVARAFLTLALDRDPEDTDIWTSFGRVQRETGDLEASTKSLRKAMELDAANFDSVYWLAANRMDQNDPAEAETLLRRIVVKDDEFGHAWYRLGELAMLKNDPKTAIELFEKARIGGVDKKLVKMQIAECRKAMAPKAAH